MQVPKRRSEQNIKRDSGPMMVTAEGLERLKRTLDRVRAGLPAMIKEVERTKEHGDFSENAAYQDAKATLRRAHSRVASLEDRIKRAVIIEKAAGDVVQLGSTVVLETGGKQFTFEILGPHEANPSKGRISDQSPLGKALIGSKAGDTVTIDLQGKSVDYRLVEVR